MKSKRRGKKSKSATGGASSSVPRRPRRRGRRYLTSGSAAPALDGDANLATLATEQRNSAAEALDLKSTQEILEIINREDASVAPAVRHALPQIARAVECTVESLHHGGRLIYVGAGTSGRLGVLDASECPPTFNVSPQTVVGVIAGGTRALQAATEASEDDPYLGRRDMRRLRIDDRDTVVGIAASGRTPYTIGAVEYARASGARTVAIVCTSGSPLARAVEVPIEVVTGPEVVAGSTRMKAGTAQKLVLNMISTAAMVRTGHVFGNLMVNVRQSNQKLVARALRILGQATGLDEEQSGKLLAAADYDVKTAILMHFERLSLRAARERLQAASGNLRSALTPRGGSI